MLDMRTLILILLFSVSVYAQKNDTIINVIGDGKLIKERATNKEFKKIKRLFMGKTLTTQKRINGVWYKCTYEKRCRYYKIQSI